MKTRIDLPDMPLNPSLPEKILFLCPIGQLGGAERCLIDTLWSLNHSHPQIHLVLISGSSGPVIDQAISSGASARSLNLPGRLESFGDSSTGTSARLRIKTLARLLCLVPATFLYFIRLRRQILLEKPSLVHVVGLTMQILSLLAVPRKIPIVWNIQDYIGHRRISRLILLIALFWFGRNRRIAAACCSDDVRKDLTLVLKNRYLCSIATIHNTVDLQTFNPNGPIHDLNNSNPKAIRIGLIATYAKWKGQDVFIQAISLLRQDITEFQAYLIGGPIYDTSGSQWSASELQQLADHYGLQNRLQIIPFQANSADVMRSLDIVVHASTKPEPFGRVIAEAQACARCVVAVNSGGSAEAFDDGLTGLGVNRNDAQDLSAKLTQLLLDQILMKKLASHGPGFVSTRFDRRDLAAKWLNVYQAILP